MTGERTVRRAGAALIAAVAAAFGGAAAEEAIPVKREILALYDGAQEGFVRATRIHRFAEMPLNHLGFVLRFQDVRAALPDPGDTRRYQGVLTWFAGPVADSGRYLDWASRVVGLDVNLVILGDVGVPVGPGTLGPVNRLLEPAGVRHTGDYVGPTLGTRVRQADPGLAPFECRLGPVLPDYPVVLPSRSLSRAGVRLETPSWDGARQSVPVAIGDRGGYAAWSYEMCHQRPPLYQGQWLIDPFAFFRAAFHVDDFPIPDTTTVSGNRMAFIVVGSDGMTRPSRIEGFQDSETTAGEVVLRRLIAPFPGLPATLELHGAELAAAQKDGSPAKLLLRDFLARPGVDLLTRPMQATVSRFDAEYPSVSNLAPLFSAEPERFVNRPLGDDTAYDTPGEPEETGFAALLQTLAGTDAPRRLEPFDLNYHAYAGEYPARLQSVLTVMGAADAASLTPVSANRYAAIADGFRTARIERIGADAWRIADRGALQTVRFDPGGRRVVDVGASAGVIGSRQVGSALYVALDETTDPAVVALIAPGAPAPAGGLALVSSRWMIHSAARDGCGLRLEAHGYGEGAFVWSGASGRYVVAVDRGGEALWRGTAEADDAGRLTFVAPIGAVDPVQVQIGCDNESNSK